MTENLKKILTTIATLSVVLIVLALLFFTQKPKLTEEEKFIEANTEITCEILKDPSLAVDIERSRELSNEIFKKYDFVVEDNDVMLELLNKYEENEEVLNAIKEKLATDCKL